MKFREIIRVILSNTKLSKLKLEDGSEVEIDGDKIEKDSTVERTSADGTNTPIEDGTFTTADGDTFTTVGGVVTKVKEKNAEEDKKEETPAPTEQAKNEEPKAPTTLSKDEIVEIAQSLVNQILAAIAELKTSFSAKETENKVTQAKLSKAIETLAEGLEVVSGEPSADPIKKELPGKLKAKAKVDHPMAAYFKD